MANCSFPATSMSFQQFTGVVVGPRADATSLVSGFERVDVLGNPRMAVLACSAPYALPMRVLRDGDCFQVLRQDASPIPTEMIDVGGIADRSNPNGVGNAMCESGAISCGDLPIAVTAYAAAPHQAFSFFGNAGHQAMLDRPVNLRREWDVCSYIAVLSPPRVVGVTPPSRPRSVRAFSNQAWANILGSHATYYTPKTV